MKKWILIGSFLFTISLQAQDYQLQIYNAYLQGRMDRWKGVMEAMTSAFKETGDMNLLYQLAEVEYGYMGYSISMNHKKEAERILIQAEEHIKLLLRFNNNDPRVYSLQGAFYGYWLKLQPVKAPGYAQKSTEANRRALQLGPTEPQAWMEKANIEFYKPAIFGGSKKQAVPLYEKAAELFEASPERIRHNWIYLNCLTGLGLAYEKTGNIEGAGEVYRKLLNLEPSFSWVRDELYPQFLKNHSGN